MSEWTIERQRELDGVVVVEVTEGYADQGDALTPDHRHGGREQPPRRGKDRLAAAGPPRQCVRPRRAGEVIEPQPKHHRAAYSVSRTKPARQAVDKRDEVG